MFFMNGPFDGDSSASFKNILFQLFCHLDSWLISCHFVSFLWNSKTCLKQCTLNSLISTQQILFFLRKFSYLRALLETYTFMYFQGKFLPTQLLEYLCLFILAEIPSYKIILSSFKLLFSSYKHFKEASMS